MTSEGPSKSGDRVRGLHELARDIQPARDLWASIESGLDEPRRRTESARRPRASLRWMPWAAFASMAAVAVIAVLNTRDAQSPTGIGDVVPAQIASSEEARYEAERAALVAQMPARIAALPTEARQGATASLDAIRIAEAEVQAAIAEDAADPLLLEMLIAVRQEEMRVMTNLQDNDDQERLL